VSLNSDGDMDKLKSWGEAITDRVNTLEVTIRQLQLRVKNLEDRLSAYEEAHVDKLMEKNAKA
jgi:hypothetical protein